MFKTHKFLLERLWGENDPNYQRAHCDIGDENTRFIQGASIGDIVIDYDKYDGKKLYKYRVVKIYDDIMVLKLVKKYI